MSMKDGAGENIGTRPGAVERPVFEGVSLPSLPLPWGPFERMRVSNEVFEVALSREDRQEGELREVRNYLKWAGDRYVLPGSATRAMQRLMDYDKILTPLMFTYKDDTEYREMIRKFEYEYLQLEGDGRGTRWWESSAGFSGGDYPAEPIAEKLGISGTELLDIVRKQSGDEDEWVIIKTDSYLIPVTHNPRNPQGLRIDGVMELSEVGLAVLDKALRVYELGNIATTNT